MENLIGLIKAISVIMYYSDCRKLDTVEVFPCFGVSILDLSAEKHFMLYIQKIVFTSQTTTKDLLSVSPPCLVES